MIFCLYRVKWRQIMGTRITRIISVITILSVVCMLLSSCGNKKMPAYVLVASEDSGIVQAFNAYFELDGNSLKEVRQVRYENLVERTNNYTQISFQTYSFKASSTNGNPSDYVFTQDSHDSIAFDKGTLVKYLRKMGVFWTGEIQIRMTAFDGYIILEAWHNDGGAVSEIKTGLFRNSKYIELPKDSSLKSVAKVFKKL